jgi:uncharacterized protein (TIGR02466 family)|tara:strand:- start:75 stop:665 length:591 start_codon:yes stop_codon:yes gene_type:complete
MKHLSTIPICSNTLFIYRLDIKNDLTLKFKNEKFTSLEGGSHVISQNLNILKKYKNLNKEINRAIDATLEESLMLKNIKYRIFSSWLTKSEPETFSESHSHSNSWLSGIYYPKGDPGFGVKFFNDITTQFATTPTEYNIYNSAAWTIIPEDNYLILFFSQLRHKIMPNKSTKDRFSLAFNILPKGQFGEIDSKVIF